MIKKLSAKQFRELGYLQELNRRFLHPLGMALEIIQDDSGNEVFGEVWDLRDDPEGIIYAEISLDDRKRIEEFEAFAKNKHELRERALGYIVQF